MKKDLNKIIQDIRSEVVNLNFAVELLEVSNSSIKRERFCKKHKISLNRFLELYGIARNEILMYPVTVHTLKAIVDQRGKTKKEYDTLRENVIRILREMIDKVKENENITKGAEEMEKFLDDLKVEKV